MEGRSSTTLLGPRVDQMPVGSFRTADGVTWVGAAEPPVRILEDFRVVGRRGLEGDARPVLQILRGRKED